MANRLDENTINEKLQSLAGWSRDGDSIKREFKFPDFKAAFAFMTECADVAEGIDHHPDWSNVYNRVNVQLSTHDAGGITENDFTLATRMNEIAAKHS